TIMAPLSALALKNRSLRAARAACLALLALVAAASCTSAKDTEDYVPSQPGAVQPDTNGKLIDEATACTELSNAESSARSTLGCAAAKHTCPDYIRPVGGADCFKYDEGSVKGCATKFDSFMSCDDFDRHPCVVTAKSECATADTSEGGMGGVGGAPAEGGSSGMADVSGPAGAGGSAP
ncbi:MAG TPA: hypothetical protein VIK01_13530, partial [Polyangiaceae bacterium]